MKFFNCILLFVVIVGAASSPCSVNKTCTDYFEECSDCASSCPTTCQSVCQKSRPCTKECKVSQCVCKSGLIRDEVSSKCINLYNCPKCECPKNEVYISCDPNCEWKCNDITRYHVPVCSLQTARCLPVCMCATGLLRHETTGMCVTMEKCPAYLGGKQ